MKIRTKSANGRPPTAEDGPAPGTTANPPTVPPPADPLVVVAAAFTPPEPPRPASRRVNAAAVHINAAAPGTSSSPPTPSHDSKFALNPDTAPRGDATDITGALAAAAGGAATTTVAASPDETGDEPDCPDTPIAPAGATAVTAGTGADATPEPADPPVPPPTALSPSAGTEGLIRSACPRPDRTPPADCPTDPSAPSATTGTSDTATGPRDSESASTPPETADAGASEALPPRAPRVGLVCARGVLAEVEFGDPDDAPLSPELLDPPDPVVSANATAGMAATAAPTPNATANAPTLPTYRA